MTSSVEAGVVEMVGEDTMTGRPRENEPEAEHVEAVADMVGTEVAIGKILTSGFKAGTWMLRQSDFRHM
jgi:hypothetical protein